MELLTFYCDRQRHLVCRPYSTDNLHRMARQLGLNPRWYHAGATYAHYDIPKRRQGEIMARCQIVRPRDIVAIARGA